MPTDENGWWEQERAELIRRRIDSLAPQQGRLIDVGCGRGTMLDDERFDDRITVKADSHVWSEWSSRSGRYVCARADALPFRDGAFDLVGSFDVLEHLPDDVASLREQRRVARDSGHVVAAVPADPRLWSPHDDAVGHVRRYTRASLERTLRAAGLAPVRTTHFFSYLWLPARLLRTSETRRDQSSIAATTGVGSLVRATIHAISGAERMWTARWPLPFGTSLWSETRLARG